MKGQGNVQRGVAAFVLVWLSIAGTALADNGRRAHGAPSAGKGRAHKAHPQQKRSQRAAPKAKVRHGRRSHERRGLKPSRPAHRHVVKHTSGRTDTPPRKVTICHATGSETNPYVEITISERALKAHARHQDGRDIIPAPAGGCPGAAAGGGETGGSQTPPTSGGGSPETGESGPTQQPLTPAVLGVHAEGGQPGGVAGQQAQGGVPAGQVLGARASGGGGSGNLPFTGLGLLALLGLGGATLLGGVGLRRTLGRS